MPHSASLFRALSYPLETTSSKDSVNAEQRPTQSLPLNFSPSLSRFLLLSLPSQSPSLEILSGIRNLFSLFITRFPLLHTPVVSYKHHWLSCYLPCLVLSSRFLSLFLSRILLASKNVSHISSCKRTKLYGNSFHISSRNNHNRDVFVIEIIIFVFYLISYYFDYLTGTYRKKWSHGERYDDLMIKKYSKNSRSLTFPCLSTFLQ